ncbi:Arc family DNA-binding protein [Pseudomonas sp. PH1b]|uniref:Arc family DNA-binding protein n=1 Tax=Pseudomonas sp. PH1b TaxID=1397282 RepID=UPI0004695B82|nr:Arc family DNA-binding protein [Pseudomonas sp. PH1b]
MRNINPFGLRLQPDLKARIEAAAEKNRRSINAEIHARLEESFAQESITQPLSEHEAAMQVLAQMYQETLDNIYELKSRSSLSPMEQVELQHEEATAKYLRQAAARASMAPEDRPARGKRKSMPIGIDTKIHLAALAAEHTPKKPKE